MKINDFNYSSQALKAKKTSTVQSQVQLDPLIKRAKNSVEDTPQSQPQTRLDVNENALALAKEQYSDKNTSFSNTPSANQSNFSQYDQPSKQNQTAVASYNTVDTLAQRENIKQVFGVNLFA